MAKNYQCKYCGFSSPGPGPLGLHYKDSKNAKHRPPYWADRHSAPSQKKQLSAKRPGHQHLSVVGAKTKQGSWAKQMSESRGKLEALRTQLDLDLAGALRELEQAQSTVDYLSKLRDQLAEALGENTSIDAFLDEEAA